MAIRKILVINRDSESNYIIKSSLTKQRYHVIFAHDQLTGIEKAKSEKPDLILVNTSLEGINGFKISHKLKENSITRFIPIIALVDLPDILTGNVSSIEAEAHLIKPFNPESLTLEIEKLLKITTEQLSANPLTRLPGNITVEKNVTSRIAKGKKFATSYVDIDDFKPYNDYYGFHKGDQVIKLLGKILVDASNCKGNEDDLVGHVGGDDFVLVTAPEKVDDICHYVIETFDREIVKHYNREDLEAGYITVKDRQFQVHNFPVMTISIAVVTNEIRDITHYGKVIDILVETRKYIKSHKDPKKSTFLKDRRKD